MGDMSFLFGHFTKVIEVRKTVSQEVRKNTSDCVKFLSDFPSSPTFRLAAYI